MDLNNGMWCRPVFTNLIPMWLHLSLLWKEEEGRCQMGIPGCNKHILETGRMAARLHPLNLHLFQIQLHFAVSQSLLYQVPTYKFLLARLGQAHLHSIGTLSESLPSRFGPKEEIRKTVKISKFLQNQRLEICAIIFKDGVEEMIITLFNSIPMLCGTNNILQNIPHIQCEYEEYFTKYLVPQNIVMDLNNVMMRNTNYFII